MKLLHRIGMNTVDKLILVIALFLVSLDVSRGFKQIGWDLFTICTIVFLCYAGVCLFVKFLCFFVRTEGWGANFIRGLISMLLVFLIFPKVLVLAFIFMRLPGLNSLVETMIIVVFAVRAAVASYLGYRWKAIEIV